MRKILSFLLLIAGFSFAANAAVVLTAEAPGVQTSQVPGVITETFETIPLGLYLTGPLVRPIGTFTGLDPGFAILPADDAGGAGGVGRYFVVGTPAGLTTPSKLGIADLTFNSPQTYVGLWLSSISITNTIELYSGTTQLASFNYNTIQGKLGAAYVGNPTPPFLGRLTEKFAYLNFNGTANTTFNRIRFTEEWVGGLEVDNISIRASAAAPVPAPASAFTGAALLSLIAISKSIHNRCKRCLGARHDGLDL